MGQAITITRPSGTYIAEHQRGYDWRVWRADAPDKVCEARTSEQPKLGYTLVILYGEALGAKPGQTIYIPCPEAKRIEATAKQQAATAKQQAVSGPKTRDQLACAVAAAVAGWREARERLSETDWSAKSRAAEAVAEAKVQQADAALRQYDQDHPGETAARKTEREALCVEHQWD